MAEKKIIALAGNPNSGKTTLFNIVAGLLEPDGGNVEMDGENINGKWRIFPEDWKL